MKKVILSLACVSLLMVSCNSKSAKATDETAKTELVTAQTKTVVLGVNGKCDDCKTRIEKAATSVPGVTAATWDLTTKKLSITFDPSKTSEEAISKEIAKAGHDTDMDKASDADYAALPSCCKYRDADAKDAKKSCTAGDKKDDKMKM